MSGAVHGLLASLAGVIKDTFFRYVTLLLNTSATNGAQNNTFLDSSTNAFSITRNGNTTQGTFSPFSQTGWSNYFDGTGDYLTLASNAAFGLGTGDFTIEMWVYATANPVNGPGTIFDLRTGVTATATAARVNSSLSVIFYDGPANIEINTGTIQLNTWAHIAHVRASGSLKTYINGTLSNTTAVSSDLGTNQPCMIGNNQTAGYAWNGYLSNFRIVKGTAVYTANFTPPTSPLTAITNTSLLTCQSNRFIDNSSNAFAITRNGDVSVQAFSPFAPAAAWSAATYGGSGYFDGAGDYLSAAGNTAFDFGTGDFTVEAWVYLPATQTQFAAIACQASTGNAWYLSFGTGNTVTFSNYATTYITSSSGLTNGAWSHVAVSRSGTSLKMFINGVEVGSATNSVSLGVTANLFVGFNNATHYVNGYISNLRIVKGTAVYTAAFTPPTAPLTAITNTSLLCNFTNAGIYDSASGNDLETVGNAQVSTVQAKWGTTSLAFDGTGDWLYGIDKPIYWFGTGDFTVECWIYFNSTTGTVPIIANGLGISGSGTIYESNWSIYLSSSNLYLTKFVNPTQTDYAFAWTPSTGQWYHVAITRSGTSLRAFVNGSQIGTTQTSSLSFSGATNNPGLSIGRWRTGVGGATINELNGYIDDLRVTNGVARYTSNFTAPTAAFPLQ